MTRSFPESGDYIVDKSFSISAGCWRISFDRGNKLKFDSVTKKLSKFSDRYKEWRNVTPPIDSETTFALALRYGEKSMILNLKAVDHDADPVEMTIEEIEEILGYKIKIV